MLKLAYQNHIRAYFGVLEQQFDSFDEWAQACATHLVTPDKREAPSFVPATFDMTRRCDDANCDGSRLHRKAVHVSSITAFVVDLDSLPLSKVEDLLSLNAGRSYFAYSTFSYAGPDVAKCRVVFELDAPIPFQTPRHWAKEIWPRLLSLVGLSTELVDKQCSDPSRCYFVPCVASEDAPKFFRRGRGEPIHTSSVLATLGPEKLLGEAVKLDTQLETVEREQALLRMHARAFAKDAWVIDSLRGGHLPDEGRRHELILTATRWLAELGANEITVGDVFAEWVNSASREQPDRDWRREILDAYRGAVKKVEAGEFGVEQTVEEREYEDVDSAVLVRWERMYGADFIVTETGEVFAWTGEIWSTNFAGSKIFETSYDVGVTYRQEADTQFMTRCRLKKQFEELTQKQLSSDGLLDVTGGQAKEIEKELTECDRKLKVLRSHEKLCKSTKGINLVNKHLREYRARVPRDNFDADCDVLAVGNGVVDLRTGTLGEFDRRHLVSRKINTKLKPNVTPGEWAKFLEEIQPDEQVRSLIQRLVGRGLLGDTSNNWMVVFLGRGANGKTAFVRNLFRTLEGVTSAASESLLMKGFFPDFEDNLAALKGARLVSVPELEGRIDPKKFKAATGGETLNARAKGFKSFQMRFRGSLFCTSNELPELPEGDRGVARRLVVIPFEQDFEGSGVDVDARLANSSEEILTWAVDGAWLYLRDGARPGDLPVLAETKKEWLAENATVNDFVEQCLDTRTTEWTKASEIFSAYKKWAEVEGHEILTQTAFGKRLKKYVRAKRENRGVFYRVKV